jgi:hypothetical protein
MARLPIPGSDDGAWGDILNEFLKVELDENTGGLKIRSDGTLATKANDSAVVHLAGTETVSGDKNFTGVLSKSGQAVVVSSDGRLSDARLTIKKGGVTSGTRKNLNFIAGSGVTVDTTDQSGSDTVDVTIAASGGTVVPRGNVLGLVPNQWYAPTPTDGSNIAKPHAHAHPFTPARSCTINAWAIQIIGASSTSGAKLAVAIYNDDGNGEPGTRVEHCGSVSIESASGWTEVVTSVALTAGQPYWAIMAEVFPGGTGVNASYRGRSGASPSGLIPVSAGNFSIGAGWAAEATGWATDGSNSPASYSPGTWGPTDSARCIGLRAT